jgi:hypothetical protein
VAHAPIKILLERTFSIHESTQQNHFGRKAESKQHWLLLMGLPIMIILDGTVNVIEKNIFDIYF